MPENAGFLEESPPTVDISVRKLSADGSKAIVPLYRTYARRWYILIAFGVAGFLQSFLETMWMPIFASMQAIYYWDNSQLALFSLYGSAISALLIMPSAWLLQRFGQRKLVLLTTLLTAFSTIIRCVPLSPRGSTILINISAILNAVAGVVPTYLPPYISAHWFPLKERSFATALGLMMPTAGIASAFLCGPAFIPQPPSVVTNDTRDAIEVAYFGYTYIETGATVILFLLVSAYYPDKPPMPPSESAKMDRVAFGRGSRRLLKSVNFWLVCAPITLVTGSCLAWSSMLSVDLATAKSIDQYQVGWLGFYATVAGCMGGIIAGLMGDIFGRLKAIMIACCLLAIEATIWLALNLRDYLPYSLNQTYIAMILIGVSCTAIAPVNNELAAEICYPVDEAVVVGLMGVILNTWISVFCAVLLFPVGIAWIDWFFVCSCLVALPLTLLIRERYRRTEVDKEVYI